MKLHLLAIATLSCLLLFSSADSHGRLPSIAPDDLGTSFGTSDGAEEWGYLDVREGAHMFWWFYRSTLRTKNEWPLVLWLQGGPGASSVGYGDFEEIGPLTTDLMPREYTWLKKADLLFVDSPVGTGFSYVDNDTLLASSDDAVAVDLLRFFQTFYLKFPDLQQSPLYIVAESYGGKHATLFGLVIDKAIKGGAIKAVLGGVALGNAWISPVDYVTSWGPVLRIFGRIDGTQEKVLSSQAEIAAEHVKNGSYFDAYNDWYGMEDTLLNMSNADIYNLLLDNSDEETSSTLLKRIPLGGLGDYFRKGKQLERGFGKAPDIKSLMNGPIRKKLKIVPDNVTWEEEAISVFIPLVNEFMQDVIPKVDELLSAGINLTIYNGQLDLICATYGTEKWVEKLKWPYLSDFLVADRTPLFCSGEERTGGYVKSYKNLSFYWILRAGHAVPTDNPCMAFDMFGMITSS